MNASSSKHVVKLDRERELKFTMPVITLLDEEFKINVFNPSTYDDFSPSKAATLVWAGQLHTKNPLRRDAVIKHIPTSMEGYMATCMVVAQAIRDAIKDPTPSTADKQ